MGKIFFSLYIVPMYRDIFTLIAVIWYDHVNFSSTSTPKNLATGLRSIGMLLILGTNVSKQVLRDLEKSM